METRRGQEGVRVEKEELTYTVAEKGAKLFSISGDQEEVKSLAKVSPAFLLVVLTNISGDGHKLVGCHSRDSRRSRRRLPPPAMVLPFLLSTQPCSPSMYFLPISTCSRLIQLPEPLLTYSKYNDIVTGCLPPSPPPCS